MTAVLSPNAKQQFFDNVGRPLVNGKLFTYGAGTVSKIPSYVDSAGITTNSNPIILNFRGECNLWIPPNVAYKYVLAPSTDTDPPLSPIWTVDNIVSSQLITLYGGVDTGAANAYVLNFVSNFTTYTDGIIIYWIPSNNNTGPSTLNVNSLGVIPIVNSDGTPLYKNQIVANQVATVLYKSGTFILISTSSSQAFNASRVTTEQAIPASSTITCLFNQINVNNGGGYNSGSGRFTAATYGIYQFNLAITMSPAGTNNELNRILISKNGSTTVTDGTALSIGTGLRLAQYSNTGNQMLFSGSAIFELNPTDFVSVLWLSGTSGGGTNNLGLGSSFSGARVA